jgi:molecular chaperone HtpG
VSRSFLQADGNVKKINNYITKKVADKLSELYKKDRKAYEAKWSDIGLFVKYGMISEDKFYEKGKEFTLLKNTKDEYFTLDEYREKVKAIQTDKNEQTIFLYATDLNKQDGFIQSAEKKGFDVLVLDSPIDSHFIQHLESKLEKTQLKRVDADVVEKLIQTDSTYANLLTEDQSKAVKELFEKAINNKNYTVEVEGLSPEEMPVTITMEEWMRRMKDMAQTGGGPMSFYGSLPDSYKVAINGNHPMVDKVLKAESEEEKERLAKQAFDLALLSQGLLTGKDLTAFVKRSVEMI